MESITAYMQQDHVLIDGILERAAAASAARDFAALERETGLFLQRLALHIEMEERLLFPAFEERTGMIGGGPSAQMRAEHEAMQGIFLQMRAAVESKDSTAWQRASQALLEVLVPHNLKEEQMMYPMLDQVMGEDGSNLLAEVRDMAT